MKTQKLGNSNLVSTRLAYGCMRIPQTWEPSEITPAREKAGVASVLAAYEAGYRHFDHADIYANGGAESIFGKAIKQNKQILKDSIITSKCGIRWENQPKKGDPHRWDFSKKHILWSCDQSLKRLGVEQIDLYLLHRPDFLADPTEIAEAFSELKKKGKVAHFGVSNFRPSLLSAVQKACSMPLIVNQIQCSLGHLEFFEDGTLDQCLDGSVTPMAYSPLAGGLLGNSAKVDEEDSKYDGKQGLLNVLDVIAKEHSTTRVLVALAWLLKHPAKIVPVVGTTKADSIKEAAKADELELSREQWYRLMRAAKMEGLP